MIRSRHKHRPGLLIVLVVLMASGWAASAQAATFARSQNVALIPSSTGLTAGVLPTFGTVLGRDGESFDQFAFTDLAIADISAATLSGFDTVVLNQVFTTDLDAAAQQALAHFVTGGGKLIIHDSDGTTGNDYSWLPTPAQTGVACQNCGNTTGTASVVENNTLVSSNPADASFVDPSELADVTDAIGDANVMVSQDDRWFKDIVATNGNGDTGAVHTYATDNGLTIFNGFDTDAIGSTQASGVDWLGQMWWAELAQPWSPDGLPHGTPLNCSNTIGAVSPGTGTVPEAGRPGTTITITGKSFCPGTIVQFGNTSARVAATVQSTTQLTAIVPRAATSAALQLINPDGQPGPKSGFIADSYRNTNGFQFGNYSGVGRDFGFDDIAAAFGDNAFETWRLCSHCPGIKVHASAANQVENVVATSDGLCFGFALGSLRLSQLVDTALASPRTNSLWTEINTWALPEFRAFPNVAYDPTVGTYGPQMGHYLYQQQARQFSTQYIAATSAYAAGLKSARDKGAYLLAKTRAAIANGMALIGMSFQFRNPVTAKLDVDGHELVAFDVEDTGSGTFAIDVYDGNQAFDPHKELENASAHDAMLKRNQIHVSADGHWTYDGDFGAPGGGSMGQWSGGPDELQPVAFSAMHGPFNPGVATGSNLTMTAGAEVLQLTDAAGRSLYDPQGLLVAPDQRADAVVMAVAATKTTAGVSAPPVLLLNPAERYTETLGSGTQQLLSAGLDGEIKTARGGQAVIAAGTRKLSVTPQGGGRTEISMTRKHRGRETTVRVAGKAKLSLEMGSSVTVTSASAQTLSLTISRVGPNQPPSTFASKLHLAAGQRAELGAPGRLRVGGPTLRVGIVGGRQHGRHTVRLRNGRPQPRLRLTRVSAHHGRRTTVTARLVTTGARGGRVTVTVLNGRHGTTVQARAGAAVTVRVPVGSTRRHGRLGVLAVVTRAQQTSRTATAISRAT